MEQGVLMPRRVYVVDRHATTRPTPAAKHHRWIVDARRERGQETDGATLTVDEDNKDEVPPESRHDDVQDGGSPPDDIQCIR